MSETMLYNQALAAALNDEMAADPNVFVFGLDVPDHKGIFGSVSGLLQEFGPRRVFGTPLSEEAMTGVALGAALSGLRPVHTHIRVDFMLLGMNQIVNMISNLRYLSAGQLKLPLVLRAVIGRGWGQSSQHSKSLQSIFAHIPGLKVIMPTTPQDAYSLLRSAVRDDNPVICLEHRWLYFASGQVDKTLKMPLGEALVRKPGKDISIVSTSWMTVEALRAAEILAEHGVEAEVIDVRSISPLDTKTIINSVKKTKNCIVADYDWLFCGLASEIAAEVSHQCFGQLARPVEKIGFAPVPCPTTRPLENLFYPSAATIIRQVEKMLSLKTIDLSHEKFYSWEERFKGPF